MTFRRRLPMPKLPPFALAEPALPAKKQFSYLLCFSFFAALLIALHLQLFDLPFFWDEHGQFIPTALDLLRTGSWIAHSTTPNVHPPGIEVYLVLWYKLFGFSIPLTRVAMLLVAAAGLLFTFLLAIELSRDAEGAPAFLPLLLLLASPLFYTQSMMAQLDMPAMVLTLLALLPFLKERYAAAAIACVALVLVKETGLVVPAVFGAFLLLRKQYKRALLFIPSALALAAWLLFLHSKTGYWLGNPGFAHYNVGYALSPVRVSFSLLRRIYYLFFAEFRWIGTLALFYAAHKLPLFLSYRWRITLAVSAATVVLVSVLGGAELERYLLPVLPVFYIAVSIAITRLPKRLGIAATLSLLIGLVGSLFWNPPYPFPYENNYAMVDFVRLQQAAAKYAENSLAHHTIATAWPFSAALRSSDYGYVSHPLQVIETGDFHFSSINALPSNSFDVLIVYTRTWVPQTGVLSLPLVRDFLRRFYEWEPQITPADCALKGLEPQAIWHKRGQTITVYVRKRLGL
jgi:hypothetical protein